MSSLMDADVPAIWIATNSLDTDQPFMKSIFKLYRRQLIIETMSSFWVVEHLDVIEDVVSRFLSGCIDFSFNSLTFEQLKKAFCNRIVMTVTTPTHAAFQTMCL